jgi:hypothetical protein
MTLLFWYCHIAFDNADRGNGSWLSPGRRWRDGVRNCINIVIANAMSDVLQRRPGHEMVV